MKYIVEVNPNTGTLDPTTAVPYEAQVSGALTAFFFTVFLMVIVGLVCLIKK